jgi:DNA polymerase
MKMALHLLGQLLDKALYKLAWDTTKDFIILNTVMCRPPNNRTPTDKEILACSERLKLQLSFIKPSVIILMGRTSINAMIAYHDGWLGDKNITDDCSIADMAQNCINATVKFKIPTDFDDKIMTGRTFITYHPAALLRNPKWKDAANEHWLAINRHCVNSSLLRSKT